MFQLYIMDAYSQDKMRGLFVGISNICHDIENEKGNEDIRFYHYNLGKAITYLYILNDTLQSYHDEIPQLINQLFVIADDVRRKIRGNNNGSIHAVFQTAQIFLIGYGPDNGLRHERVKWNYIAAGIWKGEGPFYCIFF